MKDDTLANMLEELKECGINFASLARENGLCKTYLGVVHMQHIRMKCETQFLLSIEKRIRLLKGFSFKNSNLEKLTKEVGLRESYIANQLGISRQRLNEQKKLGLPEHRQKQIEKIIKEVGTKIEKALHRFYKLQKYSRAA